MYLIYFLNIDILALNTDILPDILNNDILSSFSKRGKLKIFILFSYPNRGNRTNMAEEGCGEWFVSDGVGPQGMCPHDLFGGVGCTIEILMGGRGWLMGVAVKDVGSLRSLS